jgi:hypothetical protein
MRINARIFVAAMLGGLLSLPLAAMAASRGGPIYDNGVGTVQPDCPSNDPQCQNAPPDSNGNRHYNNQNPWRDRHLRDPGYGNYGTVYPTDDWARCRYFGRNLWYRGFRHVVPLDCSGRYYDYSAWYDGERVEVRVRASNGRVVGVR